jgi:hypothetical protein
MVPDRYDIRVDKANKSYKESPTQCFQFPESLFTNQYSKKYLNRINVPKNLELQASLLFKLKKILDSAGFLSNLISIKMSLNRIVVGIISL